MDISNFNRNLIIMKTKKIDKKQVSVKNLLICLNTYKNLSNFFTTLSKTAKISAKKFGYFKKLLYFCNIKLTPKNIKL